VFDVGQGPDNFDLDDSVRWLPIVGAGSKVAYTTMERFISTIDNPALAARLSTEIHQSGAFRRSNRTPPTRRPIHPMASIR